MWGRLSSLRPAFQPAWVPFTHRPLLNPMLCLVGADQRVRPLFSYLRVLRGLFFSVSSVVCLLRALPTPSHNLPQIFFPFLFNHLPTPPFPSSCSPLVC